MKNLLKRDKTDYKAKCKELESLLNSSTELVDALVDCGAKTLDENQELKYQIESLRLEVKKKTVDAERFYRAAVLIAKQNDELKKENTTLKIRNNIIEHKEVNKNARTQSNGCGA